MTPPDIDRDPVEQGKRAYTEKLPGVYDTAPKKRTLQYYQEKVHYKIEEVFFGPGDHRQAAIDGSSLKPGDSVLNLCCGSGLELPAIIQRIGPQGYILGLDYSELMLDQARLWIKEQGHTNIELQQADCTADLSFGRQFDMTFCAYGLSIIPRWEACYENMVNNVKVGGEVLVEDARYLEGWASVLNPVFLGLTRRYGATDECLGNFKRVGDRMRRDLTDVRITHRRFTGTARGMRRG
ncbi:MAG: Methyltransferase type 11 [Deltaproteobacteria bacterium]|nr:Methyltransferase type 11 [Deltaproteobacteria bacterium]